MINNKKLLILAGPALYDYSNEYLISVADYFRKKNYVSKIYYCSRQFKTCSGNPYGKFSICMQCRIYNAAMFAENKGMIPVKYSANVEKYIERARRFLDKKKLESETELRKLFYNNYDVGLSLLTWAYCQTDSDESDYDKFFNPKQVNQLIIQAICSYHLALEAIQNEKPDFVVFFNGRTLEQRAFLRACEAEKVDFAAVEGGYSRKADNISWTMLKQGGIHDRAKLSKEAAEFWKNSIDPGKESKSVEWFHLRRKKGTSTNSFTDGMIEGEVGLKVSPGKKLVSIFTSTWAERAALNDQWQSPLGKNQYEIIKSLLSVMEKNKEAYHFVLRAHPNQETVPKEIQKLKKLECDYLTFLEPTNNCDSYALMEASDSVFTMGSTIGLEATFWGKPSVLLSPAIYSDFGVARSILCAEQFGEVISNPIVYPRENAIKMGYFLSSWEIGKSIRMASYPRIEKTFKFLRGLIKF